MFSEVQSQLGKGRAVCQGMEPRNRCVPVGRATAPSFGGPGTLPALLLHHTHLCISLSVPVSVFLTNGHVLLVSELLCLCSCFFALLPFAYLCLSFDLSTLPPLPQACHELQDDLETFLPHLPEPVGDYSSQMTSLDPELYPIQTTTHSHIQPNLAIPDRIWPYLPCCS